MSVVLPAPPGRAPVTSDAPSAIPRIAQAAISTLSVPARIRSTTLRVRPPR